MKYYKVLVYLDNDVVLYENIKAKDEKSACDIANDMVKCEYRDKVTFIVNDSNLNYSK